MEREITQWRGTQTPVLQALISAVGIKGSPHHIPASSNLQIRTTSTHPGVCKCCLKVMGESRTHKHFLKTLMIWTYFLSKISCLVLQRTTRLQKKKKTKEVWPLQKKQKTNNTRRSIYLKSQLCYIIVNGLCSLLSSRTKLELRRSYSEESVQLFLGTKAGRRQQRSR